METVHEKKNTSHLTFIPVSYTHLKVSEKITEKTKLIVPVHYSGNPVDLKELSEIAEDKGVKICLLYTSISM